MHSNQILYKRITQAFFTLFFENNNNNNNWKNVLDAVLSEPCLSYHCRYLTFKEYYTNILLKRT